MKADATDLPPPARALIAPEPAEAVTALYQAHALGLIRLAVVMLGDRGAAEDAVQEAFCGLYRRWHGLSDPGKALSYLRSSVINGNEFTPLNMPPVSGTVMELALGAQAGAW